eukprot:TRINITY_DN12511_c0_g1_i1.p1 TRINITY_DN12511_c0_g1~~TRINITY_DN12511_c0_g1_i1.p1  ORF type:complete len:876 (+),score=214.06 TRINITY_DN12511_c0_g1_i1:35-2662(+)
MIFIIVTSLYFVKLTQCFPQSLVTTGIDKNEVRSEGQVLPLEISKFHVSSTIQFRYTRTQVVTHFKNPGTAPNKATFTIVIPDSAFISNFSMIIKEVEFVAEVKEKEEAKQTFDEAVSTGRGAGIISKDTRDANIFTVETNIEPGEKVVFKLIYEELLERKSGMYKHSINIDPNQIVDDLKIEIFINESLPISSLSVPELVQSNEIDFTANEESKVAKIERDVDGIANNARIVFSPDRSYQEEAGSQGISGQFIVKYDVDRKGQESEVQVIDGYFVHYFVPENLETLPKHVVFVLDVSGSMSGEKIGQLKDSMFTVLDDMTETDYFNIITFSDGVSHWNPLDSKSEEFVQKAQRVIQATNENKNLAIKHILELQAGGGTNMNDAMLEGVKLTEFALQNEKLPQNVKSMIIFLTDGLPSSGETNAEAIKDNIKNANTELHTPIFSIGFGRDADFDLIKEISEQAESFSKKIYEGSDAALQLEDFFAEVASPLISNLKFDYVGGLVQNESVSKNNLKTFFKGGEYIITGKLEQNKKGDNELLSIKVVGEGRKGPFKRDLVICLRSDIEQDKQDLQDTETRSLLIPIIPPSLCIVPPYHPPRSLAQDFMQKLHAFINIKQLIKESNLASEESSNEPKEKALKLALENNFVTDLTSLVVIRPDEKPSISSLKQPSSSRGGNIAYRYSAGAASGMRTRSRPSLSFNIQALRPSLHSAVFSSISKASSPRRNVYMPQPVIAQATTASRPLMTSTTVRPLRTSATTFPKTTLMNVTFETDDEADIFGPTETIECTGNLTLFSKTYLRGEKVVLEEDAANLEDLSFDNLSVSASVSGSCCWQIFSEKHFSGIGTVLTGQGTYTSVSSLGLLFRDVSAVKKYEC